MTTTTSSCVKLRAQLNQPGHRGASRVAGEDAFLARDAARHDGRVLVGDLLEVVDDAEVHVFWQEILADTLGDVRVDLVLVEDARCLVFLEDRAVRVDAPDLDRGIPLFQKPSGAADRAAGADAADQVRDACRRSGPRSPVRSARNAPASSRGCRTDSPSTHLASRARAGTRPSSTSADLRDRR